MAVLSEKIETINDMLKALQGEIVDVKAGKLDDAKARQVRGFRALQLQCAALQLQYARLVKGRLPEPYMPLLATRNEKRNRAGRPLLNSPKK